MTRYKRLLTVPQESFFLFGVRGVGKSTWVKSALEKAVTYDLRDENLYAELLVEPNKFYREVVGLKPKSWVVVDEIQRLSSLLNEIHRLIDQSKIRFALLGSSARKLRRVGTNLLGGRAQSQAMYPFTPEELGRDFDLDRYLRYGGIPLVVTAQDPETRLRSYVQTYLKEEIQAEALVRNLQGFARFLPIAGIFHGQTLNIDGLARDAGVARTTVQGFLEILEDTLLAFRLLAFEGRIRVKEKRHPKLYWIDPGLVRASKKQFGAIIHEERGTLFEGFIIQLLRTYASIHPGFYDEMYYWAVGSKDSSVEVDVLLVRAKEILAIEIKSGKRMQEGWLNGLRAIQELSGVKRRLLIYNGERSFKTQDKIEVLTLEGFLQKLEDMDL